MHRLAAGRPPLGSGLATIVVLGLAGGAVHAAEPPQLQPPPAKIVGGTASEPCAWPSVVALDFGGLCTGVLVHPRIIAYAAHCGTLYDRALFGESRDAPAREVPILRCERNTDVFAVGSQDYAWCELAEPVEDLAPTPLLTGCDADLIALGTPVTIVGFGDTSADPDQAFVGVKHEAEAAIVGLTSTVGIGGMGVGADLGDSGGPAFVQLDDGSWRVLGTVSGGGGDGAIVQYVEAPSTVAWIEDRSGIDVSPCHAVSPEGEATWAPTPACEGAHVARLPDASWAEGCPAQIAGASARCGDPWTAITDEDPPTVAFVTPLDGDSFPAAPVVFEVEGTADDGSGHGVRELRLEIDGAPWLDAYDRPSFDQVPPYRFEAVEIAEEGEHTLELVAVDHHGHSAVATATIVVGDPDGTDTGGDTDTGFEGDDEAGPLPGEDEGGSCSCRATKTPAPYGLLLFLLLSPWARGPRAPWSRLRPTRRPWRPGRRA